MIVNISLQSNIFEILISIVENLNIVVPPKNGHHVESNHLVIDN